MMKEPVKRPDLKEKWLQDLIEKVALQSNVKREMDVLSSKIPMEEGEIEYLRDRIATALQRLKDTEDAIKNLQPRMEEPKRVLHSLQKERQTVAEEYESLREREEEIERGLADLPKLRSEIKMLGEDVRQSSERLASLKASHQEALQRKERVGEGCKDLRSTLTGLEQEINVIRSTSEILLGNRPEHFDVGTFDAIQDDVEVTFNNFTTEMTGEIEKIKNETQSLATRLDAIDKEEEDLLSKEKLLPATIEQLRSEVGEDQDREALMTELEGLERERDRLSSDAEQKKREIAREEEAIKSVDERLGKEGEINRDLTERHPPLISRKQEMDHFENAADEIQRLNLEVQRLNLDSGANRALDKTISELNSEAEQTEGRLRSSLDEYDRVFAEFEEEIEGLLS